MPSKTLAALERNTRKHRLTSTLRFPALTSTNPSPAESTPAPARPDPGEHGSTQAEHESNRIGDPPRGADARLKAGEQAIPTPRCEREQRRDDPDAGGGTAVHPRSLNHACSADECRAVHTLTLVRPAGACCGSDALAVRPLPLVFKIAGLLHLAPIQQPAAEVTHQLVPARRVRKRLPLDLPAPLARQAPPTRPTVHHPGQPLAAQPLHP